MQNGDGRPKFEVFFDGACPICRREIGALRRLDHRGEIHFIDISAATFDSTTLGKTHGELMARIHGRDCASGEILHGVEVFRRLYTLLGFGPVVAVTRLPPIAWGLDRAYAWFAANRYRLTGRACDAETCGVARG